MMERAPLPAAETSELFRQVPAITILRKPATFFHSSSTDLAPGQCPQPSADAALEYVRFLKLRARDDEAKKLLSEISRWDLGAAEEFLTSNQAAIEP